MKKERTAEDVARGRTERDYEKIIHEIAEKQGKDILSDFDFLDALDESEAVPIPFPYGGGKCFG